MNKILKTNLIILLLLSIISVNAQNALKIKESNGNISEYSLQNLRKIAFPQDGTLNLVNSDALVSNFALEGVKVMFFGTITTGFHSVAKNPDIKIYPNPTSDFAYINITSTESYMGKFQIYDISGKLVFSQQQLINTGDNTVCINLYNLNSGLYVCQIMNDVNSKILKINKK